MEYQITRKIDLYLVSDSEGHVIFYSNDGYIHEGMDIEEFRQELIILWGIMDESDTLVWNA